MAYTYEVATEHNYPNLTIWKILNDGIQTAWKITPNEGYVMYDVNATDTELDPDTMEEIPVTYYYTYWSLPLRYNFANFHWAAKLRSEVDENYIFGIPSDDHEVM